MQRRTKALHFGEKNNAENPPSGKAARRFLVLRPHFLKVLLCKSLLSTSTEGS